MLKKLVLPASVLAAFILGFFVGVKSVPKSVVERDCVKYGVNSKQCVASVTATRDAEKTLGSANP